MLLNVGNDNVVAEAFVMMPSTFYPTTTIISKTTTPTRGLPLTRLHENGMGKEMIPPSAGRNLLTKDPTLLQECPESLRTSTKPLKPDLTHVETSLIPSDPDKSDQAVYIFPLVVSPKKYTSNFCLRAFLSHNKPWVDSQILEYGAVLFRGFDIDSATEVEADIRALEPNLNNEYRGTSPRITQEGSDYVFSAAEVPSHFPIAQHLEMSFLPSPPRRLFFSALQAPQGKVGGATALTDFRKVYRDIPKPLRDKLGKKKLRYTRTNHNKGTNPLFTNDIASMKSWSEVFGTSNKTQVEEICKQEGTPFRWEGKDQNTFVSEYVSEPFQFHPETKQPVWFNHAQVFHWTAFPAELWFAFRRSKDVRFLFRSIGNWIVSILTYKVLRRKMAMDVSYGDDGTPISIAEMNQIRTAVHKNMVFNQWQKGDLLMIDNFSTSHGREPTYAKGRKVVVAWSDPLAKSNDFVYGTTA